MPLLPCVSLPSAMGPAEGTPEKKSALTALLIPCLALTLAACGGSPSSAPGSTSTSAETLSACTNPHMQAALSGGSGGTASTNAVVSADLVLTNAGNSPCWLPNYPQIRAFDPQGSELPNSPARFASSINLGMTLKPGEAATLRLNWLGTGQGTSCISNHFAVLGHLTIMVGATGQALTVQASGLPAELQGVCSVDAIEVTGASGGSLSGPTPKVQSPTDTALAWFAAIDEKNFPVAVGHFVSSARTMMNWADFGSVSYSNVHCTLRSQTETQAVVLCMFVVHAPSGEPSGGASFWTVEMERNGDGPWLIDNYGQG